ncbi:uncharacterized protein KY384_002956 [Bacidia gigantensis]|uniref:uncharacterized protein n=1 Tax=Bacidia gigantensis TaxID=2732470 RepID=UPI001D05706E|nr:uncharacterized protein KY384_002956 [Bacidia gigantensis]KAG8531327.1 hypothetical protein KY384_002956 [Bacidia gigantensis]
MANNNDVAAGSCGTLTKLPVEIRDIIYEYTIAQGCIMLHKVENQLSTYQRAELGVLRVNKAIYAEVRKALQLHGQFVVEICFGTQIRGDDMLLRNAQGYELNETLIEYSGARKRWEPESRFIHERLKMHYSAQNQLRIVSVRNTVGLYKDLKNLTINIVMNINSRMDTAKEHNAPESLQIDTLLEQLRMLETVTVKVTFDNTKLAFGAHRWSSVRAYMFDGIAAWVREMFGAHLGECQRFTMDGGLGKTGTLQDELSFYFRPKDSVLSARTMSIC